MYLSNLSVYLPAASLSIYIYTFTYLIYTFLCLLCLLNNCARSGIFFSHFTVYNSLRRSWKTSMSKVSIYWSAVSLNLHTYIYIFNLDISLFTMSSKQTYKNSHFSSHFTVYNSFRRGWKTFMSLSNLSVDWSAISQCTLQSTTY